MKRIIASLVVCAAANALSVTSAFAADRITGAGATFPYPVYSKWAEAYHKENGTQLNYQAIGSGGGIKQIEAHTVDFGASDKPLTPEELEKNGLMQFPTVMGGIVPIVNIKGIKPGEMVLDGKTIADIYLGKVKKWNDKEIQDLNPNLNLPASSIAVVHRADGSGTTFNFTYYLADVSSTWKKDVGVDASVQWPVGTGGKGNQGVSNYVSQLKNSIGYVEYAYALQNKLTYAKMKNKDGNIVSPNMESFQAAAAGADWNHAKGFYLILANQPGAQSWPMTAATFILLHTKVESPKPTQNVLKFFDWAYKNGDKAAADLDYVPFPSSVKDLIHTAWKTELKTMTGKLVYMGS